MRWENLLVHKQVLQTPLLALFPVTAAMRLSTCIMIVMKASLLLNKPTALTHMSVFDSHPRNPLQAAYEDGPRLHLRWRVEVYERIV